MAAMSYGEEQFKAKLQKALERVRLVLQTNRAPCFASDVHHQYQDKYALAEAMTNAAISSQANALSMLGLSLEKFEKMCSWAQTSTVSLQFKSEESCTFQREETREVESATKQVLEATGMFSGKLTSKTVTKVTEYFWKYEASYELIAIRGVGQSADDQISILERHGEVELKTNIKESPYPSNTVPANIDVNVSWLAKSLRSESGTVVSHFSIDRANANCHTPRRNRDIDAAISHFTAFAAWARQVDQFVGRLLRNQPDGMVKLDLNAINTEALFVPVLPLLEDGEQVTDASAAAAEPCSLLACLSGSTEPSGKVLGAVDTNRFLSEEARLLQEKRDSLEKSFPASGAVATAAEAVLSVTLKHCQSVAGQWASALDFIENMLRKQLIAAIGKEVLPADFADYMQFHNRKLFADAYAPVPFCQAVRRSEHHTPEGTLSIEQETAGGDSNIAAPIVTLVAHSARQHTMEFPLSASANVSFGGDKYLHAWLSHKFSGQTGASLSLVSRARQFSSFIVLVGRISSARTFDPKYAAIIQNKDELKIPLDLSTIPTPKEFKDAIQSLSPQQQAFAKAFRSMQLESTLFGILVIQIKPQLERVLNLPDDSLTKEIKLTQELMQLFIKYQIPSDLLAFDANDTTEGMQIVGRSASEKLAAVKGHVKAMYEMIAQAQKEEVDQRVMEERYKHPELEQLSRQSSNLSSDMDDCLQMDCCESECAPPAAASAPRSRMANMARSVARAAPTAFFGTSAAKSAAPSAAAPAAPMAGTAAPPPSADAAPQQPQQPQQQQQTQPQAHGEGGNEEAEEDARDYTQVPKEMDANFEKLDTDSQLRPTIITPSGTWIKRSQAALLATPKTSYLDSDEQKKEKDAAFDLLDALTKSGALPVQNASLHIVVAATHCFDKTITETVVQDDVNPIEKVERSTLIMASTVHQQPPAALIRDAQLPRVKASSPVLFLDDVPISIS